MKKHEIPGDVSNGVDHPGQQVLLDGARRLVLAIVAHHVQQARDDVLVRPLRLFPPNNLVVQGNSVTANSVRTNTRL